MARSVRSSSLESRSARLKLSVAKKPTFVKIGRGIGLGYRRNNTAGTWVLRCANGLGGNWTKAIGNADDYADADGSSILDFWQAQQRARSLAQNQTTPDKPITVGEALDRYEADLGLRGGDIRNVPRVRSRIPSVLASKTVGLLSKKELREWRDALASSMTAASLNRTVTPLRAALNLAAENDERVTNQNAWRTGLAQIPGAINSRNVILTDGEVRRIIESARQHSREFGLLVEIAAVTGARIGQLRRLLVEDLQSDPPRLLVPVSNKGRGKKQVRHRALPISAELAARLSSNRAGTEPLLTKPTGPEWQSRDHTRPFASAVKRAGFDPEVVTLYALRHSAVVRMILAGLPLRIIAANLDTSVTMLERTYSRHITDHTDAMARTTLLTV
jgi:integrase